MINAKGSKTLMGRNFTSRSGALGVLFVVLGLVFFNVLFSIVTIPTTDAVAKNIDVLVEGLSSAFMSTAVAVDNKTSHNTATKLRPLPRCNENGCAILFIHIPKTGGTSLRDTVKARNVTYAQSIFGGQYRSVVESLESQLEHPDGEPHFYEIQATTNPSFHNLVQEQVIQKWRNTSKENNVPFFVFTFLREPTPYVVSAYNMMCLGQKLCARKDLRPTPENLLEVLSPNPICYFLLMSGRPLVEQQFHPNRTQCDEMWEEMLQHMDWVGLVEEYDSTMMLLDEIGGLDLWSHQIKSNVAAEKGSLNLLNNRNLSDAHLDIIQSRTMLDIVMYQRAKEHYGLSMWEGVNTTGI